MAAINTEPLEPGESSVLTVAPDLTQLSHARDFVGDIAERAGFGPDRIFDIKVAASEALANAIEHGRPEKEVELTVCLFSDRLEISILAQSQFQLPTPDYVETHGKHRGMGLPLMAMLSDYMALYSKPDGGTLVSLTFYLPYAAHPSSASPMPPSALDLLEESALVSGILRAAPVGLYVLDPDLCFRWASPGHTNFVGRFGDRGEIIGLSWSRVTGDEMARATEALLREVSLSGEVCDSMDLELDVAGWGHKHWQFHALPLGSEPPHDVLVVFTDVSERVAARREAEKRARILNALMEYVPEGITIADADVTIQMMSRYSGELTGEPEEPVDGIKLESHAANLGTLHGHHFVPAHPDDLPLARAVKHGEILIDKELTLRRPDGSLVPLLCNAGPILEEDGRISGGVVAWRDVSALRRVELERERLLEEVQETAEELAAANEELQAQNEELAVQSEELQSLNEQLAVQGEELQAQNEELAVQGEELLAQNDELTTLNYELDVQKTLLDEVLAQLPVGLALADGSTGRIFKYNDQARRLWGPVRESLDGHIHEQVHGYRDDGTLYLPSEWPIVRSLARGEVVVGEEIEIIHEDGASFWVEMGSAPVYDAQGRMVAGVVISNDITERKRAEEEVREAQERLDRVLSHLTDGFMVFDREFRCLYLNEQASQNYQTSAEELLDNVLWDVIPALTGTVIYPSYLEAMNEESPTHFLVYRARTGDWFEHRAFPFEEGLAVFIRDVTEDKRREQERERLHSELEETARLSEALNEINGSVISTLEIEGVLHRVVVEGARALGCEAVVLELREGTDWVIREVFGLPLDLQGLRLDDEQARLSTLVAQLRDVVTIEDAQHDDRVDEAAIRRYGMQSSLVIPLVLRTEILGAILFTYTSKPRSFSNAEIDFGRKLSTSVALALENARLYQAERKIAETLQEAILTVSQDISGLNYGHLYRSATDAARVGGDFYDLFDLPGGEVAIVMGDVCGHGVEAAATSSLIKGMIKGFASQVRSPSAVLSLTNEALEAFAGNLAFATLFFGLLEPKSGQLVYCSAGHPPAILRSSSLGPQFLPGFSPVVGVFDDAQFEDREVELSSGDVLILYTDGVTEARCGDEFFGEERLLELVSGELPEIQSAPDRLFRRIMEFAGDELADDVALLAVRLECDPQSRGRSSREAAEE